MAVALNGQLVQIGLRESSNIKGHVEVKAKERRDRGPATENEVEGTERQRIEGPSAESKIREAPSSSWAAIVV